MPGRNGQSYQNVTCYTCQAHVHYSDQCPQEDPVEEQAEQAEGEGANAAQLAQGTKILDPNWILLDTCSSHSCLSNEFFIKNMRMCRKNEELIMFTNGGDIIFKKRGVFALFPVPMYYNSDTIATVVAVADILKLEGATIWFDSTKGNTIYVKIGKKTFEF